MVFKKDWEKTSHLFQIPPSHIKEMVSLAFPNQTLASYEDIATGCANLNMKIILSDFSHPFILRIYLRDQEAAYREKNLAIVLKQTIPLPNIYYIGDLEEYRFAITEFIEGITLRDLLLGQEEFDLNAIMQETGELLGKVTSHSFPKPGFLDRNLKVITEISQNSFILFAQDCLEHKNIKSVLESQSIKKISTYLQHYKGSLFDETSAHLVHGDFDPANILVTPHNDSWKISGVLDWEFASSGSVLIDIANMLRYAHEMPPAFENAFLKGLKNSNIVLPKTWQQSVHFFNLTSLLDCLMRCSIDRCPNQCADILSLINHIIQKLDL